MRWTWIAPALALLAWTGASKADDAEEFDRRVAPILARRCLGCHSGAEPKGGLDLARRESALKGGESGESIRPGAPDESLMIEYVESGVMPPKEPLLDDEMATLRAWVEGGATWGTDPIDAFRFTTASRAGRDWWSLAPLRRVEPPGASKSGWARNPIDLFIRSQLDANGLRPSPEADRRALIRRLSFDLTGLPPTPEAVEAFVADEAPGAYERLVDRYLASPEYGVRWARWWLDLARFGESNGFEHDEFRPNAWPYRDWVVEALNADLPYDEFARLQLAGDVLKPDDARAIEATGFLVAGAYDSVGQTQQSEAMRRVVRQDELEDVVGTVSQTFLGLTVHCARCHDHKFDPIRQEEYYRLASALSGVRHGERDLTALGPAGPSGRKAYCVAPKEPEITHVLIRGNPDQPGEVVAPGGVAALVGLDADFGLSPDAPEGERRARLARWITDARNPLFARVVVNRLWQAHFGAGLVETPSDLGFNGGPPSHPELLDWLASELVARGWSLKAIHRLMVTSATYRQAPHPDPNGLEVDASNRLLWRKSPTRLEAEMVRDAMLAASGALDHRLGGPGFREFRLVKAEGTITNLYPSIDTFEPEMARRTLYRAWARNGRSEFLDAFDCPDPSTTTPRRAVTTTPLQALTLLNDEFTFAMADRLADRLRREAGDDPSRQVERAYRLAFGRGPKAEERAMACRVIEAHGPSAFARAVFNSNEFLYVD